MQKDQLMQLNQMINVPVFEVSKEINVNHLPSLDFHDLKSMGSTMLPTIESIKSLAGDNKVYRVTMPMGSNLMTKKDGTGMTGSIINSKKKITGQATLNPIVVDPVTLAMTIALKQISNQLIDIKQTQDEMFDFLKLKEMAKQRGNLKVLNDIHENLQFNWNNNTYKTNKHIQVQEIKREAEQSVVLYRELIKKILSKGQMISNNSQNNKVIEKLETYFNEYHSNFYLVSFSSLLELILLNNLEPQYINSVKESLKLDAYNYRELYTNSYSIIEKRSLSSIESHVLKGFAGISKATGKTISKVPILSKGKIDEKLIENSGKIEKYSNDYSDRRLATFSKHRSVGSREFIDSLSSLEKIYSNDISLIISEGNLYIE